MHKISKSLSVVLCLILIASIFSASAVSPARDESANRGLDVDRGLDEEVFEDGYPFSEEYPSVQQLHDWYDDLVEENEDITQKIHLGESWEGRDIWTIKVSDDVEEQQDEPSVFIIGNLHTREWSTNQVAAYYLWRLVEGYGSNETITWLVDNRQIYVAPMVNPDGYIYDGEGDLNQAQGWRKNRNESVGGSTDVGTDLNRNWDIDWESGDDDPSSDTYRGESPFSEYENQHIRDFILDKDIDSFQDLHSHYGTLLIPWAHTSDPSPHDDWYRDMADDMTSMTSFLGDDSEQYSYGQPGEEIGYSAPGGSYDWVYDETGATSLCYELYTPEDGMDGFYPDEEYIMDINQDVYDSLVYQARIADTDLGDGSQHLQPPSPYLVYGTIEDSSGNEVSDVEVQVEHQDTGETLSIYTDENGYYEFNFGNLVDEGYEQGDQFTVSCEDSSVGFTAGDEWGRREDLTLDTIPPSVEITRPEGGESWEYTDMETIEWDTEKGDYPIDSIDIEYSTDGGASFKVLADDIDDTGSYDWEIPDETSDEAVVQVTATDTEGYSGQDESEQFTISGTPPDPPTDLDVEHHAEEEGILFEDDATEEKGYTMDESHDEASEWDIRQHDSAVGDNSWDFGDGEFDKVEDHGMLSTLTTPEIEIPSEAEDVELTFDHWRDFGDDDLYDAGNLKISDADLDNDFELIHPSEGYDGEINDEFENPLGGEQGWGGENVGWESAAFDLTGYAGETIHLRWEAGVEAWDGLEGEGWRVDNIVITAEGLDGDGTEDNLINWDASEDDPDEISHYNVYRSEGEDEAGPYEIIATVDADGSVDYEYVDEGRGTADDTLWWYIVEAEDEVGQASEEAGPVQEPGGDTLTLTTDSTVGGSIVDPGEGTFEYSSSEVVSLEAVADEDHHFLEWTGDTGTIEDPTAEQTNMTMEGDHAVTAEFDEADVDEVEITDPAEDQMITAGESINFKAEAHSGDELITDDRTDFEWENATRGVFNRRRAGDYEVVSTYEDVSSEPVTVTVVPAEADRIEIGPEEDTIEAGMNITYTATAYDKYENEIGEVSGETDWSINEGAGGSWIGNEYSSEYAGDWTVTGEYEEVTDIARMTVEPGEVDSRIDSI